MTRWRSIISVVMSESIPEWKATVTIGYIMLFWRCLWTTSSPFLEDFNWKKSTECIQIQIVTLVEKNEKDGLVIRSIKSSTTLSTLRKSPRKVREAVAKSQLDQSVHFLWMLRKNWTCLVFHSRFLHGKNWKVMGIKILKVICECRMVRKLVVKIEHEQAKANQTLKEKVVGNNVVRRVEI